ncbi:MAG: 2-hydroxychromene-2-carboxylate isomerase [Pseudomonadota bacterium]
MTVEIWFEFASTYSYLTVSRAEAACQQANVAFEWKPFLLGPVFQDKGLETSPFVLDPIKGAYMWRDVARRAQRFGLPFQRPEIFPMNGLRAARLMTAALDQPWCGDFARAVFQAQFAHGEDISTPETLSTALTSCGVAPDPWFERAQSDPVKAALRQRTAEAQAHGMFGAPSFWVNGELFWGDDRLEDAIAWAQSHPAAPAEERH